MKNYLNLIKPGIVIGNLISCTGGFLTASHGNIQYIHLIYVIIGMSLIISSGCIFNNIIDRDIDSIMDRTKNRILAQKNTISIKKTIVFTIILNIIGLLFLICTKNLFTILLANIGFFIYVIVYSYWMKRKFSYSTIVGSISGSMPPVIGYCTASNQFDMGALILLLIFSFWQIPHSYAITIFRNQDYKKAKIPTFMITQGIKKTRIHIIICIIGFILSTALLTITGYTSITFLFIISIINTFWLYESLYKYKLIKDNSLWSKRIFILSIIIIIFLNLLLSIDSYFIK